MDSLSAARGAAGQVQDLRGPRVVPPLWESRSAMGTPLPALQQVEDLASTPGHYRQTHIQQRNHAAAGEDPKSSWFYPSSLVQTRPFPVNRNLFLKATGSLTKGMGVGGGERKRKPFKKKKFNYRFYNHREKPRRAESCTKSCHTAVHEKRS